ncbi:hypothetical protein JXJ21_04990 [candidate division KSB1 bacterium]|nr:hypothetical protein [candidate division KSB1 bacterium]
MGAEYIAKRQFDAERYRHYVNEWNSVLHCHHYATLYTQLADDAGDLFDGLKILYDTAEESFYPVLKDYFEKHSLNDLDDRIKIVEQYCAFTGLGKMTINSASMTEGEVEMSFSHVDSGWIKKWGERDKPVNIITHGYLAAAFAVLHNLPIGSFIVKEIESIVSGAENSIMKIEKK